MISNKRRIFTLAMAAILTSSCATTPEGQQQAVGAAGGAALGCLIGALISGADGCVYGAIAGAAAGWGTVTVSQYNARQVNTAEEVQEIYGLTESMSGPVIKIDRGTSMPSTIKAGEQVNILTKYAVVLPKDLPTVEVQETWILKKDGKNLVTLPAPAVQRASGGWETNATIPMPANAESGTYVIEHGIQSGTSYDKVESVFIVSA